MFLLAFEFAHALKTVIEELVDGESGIVTDMSKAQTTCKLSLFFTYKFRQAGKSLF